MSKPNIYGVTGSDAGFVFKFQRGIDGEPDVEITELKIDCDGGDMIYSSLEACANYILDHIDELKSKKQSEYIVSDMIDDNGKLNCTLKGGKIIKN